MGSPWQVIRTCSSWIVAPSLVKMEIVPSLEVFPTLMSEVEKSSKVSACTTAGEKALNGSVVTWVVALLAPFAMPTCLVEACRIGSLAAA